MDFATISYDFRDTMGERWGISARLLLILFGALKKQETSAFSWFPAL
jgi:hypothetical protein